jgi:DNA-binding response OmpR family regulator
MKVLLIEDDQRLARLIARVLRDEHYQVDVVHDGDTGLEYALRGVYQVAIIDWMLPERDGPSICRAVRTARLPTALLLLTARGQVEDKIVGFDSGADDYLVKPFAFEELLARVRALGTPFLTPTRRQQRTAGRRSGARSAPSHCATRHATARPDADRVESARISDAQRRAGAFPASRFSIMSGLTITTCNRRWSMCTLPICAAN